jgi:nucleolar protein 14
VSQYFLQPKISEARSKSLFCPDFNNAIMPPSQLKQLKASLRDTGLLGPQKSKKQKRQNAKTGANAQNRAQRETALNAIRERFNPFEIRTVSRSKFDVTTRDGGSKSASGNFRPGVTKSLGEERVCLRYIIPSG